MAVGAFLGSIQGTSAFQEFTLAESWNGAAWQRRDTPAPGASGGLAGVSCVTASACKGVATGAALDQTGESQFTPAEAWNGTAWSVVKTPHP
jgi:hypothetical protein